VKQKEIQVRPSGEGLLKQGGSGCSFLLTERAARERAARDRATEKGGGVGAGLRGERRARGKERSRECGASRKGTHVDLLINALESQLAVAVTSPAPGGHTIDFGNKTESASLS